MLKARSKIRVMLIGGFFLCLLCAAAFAVVGYRHGIAMKDELIRLYRTSEMLDTILEARRYEKNYLLYRQASDYEEATEYLDGLTKLIKSAKPPPSRETGPEVYVEFKFLAHSYAQSFATVHRILSVGKWEVGQLDDMGAAVEEMRAAGQALILVAERLNRGQRERMQQLIDEYTFQFGLFVVGAILVGGMVVYLLVRRVVAPLHTIEMATKTVADGDFRPIPGGETHDEIGSLVNAFNQMAFQIQEHRDQIIQTEKLSALGTLTSGVAHELNNPLSNISTSCQILLEEVCNMVPDYHRDLLSAIEEQVLKARDIVRALLEYSRERHFELKPVDLREVVEDSLKLLRGEVPTNVIVREHVPEGITLGLDNTSMERALINLIMNAIQAMEDGGDLTIESEVLPEKAGVILSVADTGVGIPQELLPRIFDPFFTTKDVGRGTGMGLSITYGIIEQHRGRLHVESTSHTGERHGVNTRVRKGTKFTIWLPQDTKNHG